MAETTGISWTEATWNPWHGCIKVSPGCKFCYMYRDKAIYGQDPMKVVRSKTKFNDPLLWEERKMVFTCSWSDWFIDVADPWRDEAWDIIRRTPHLTYQILTKRPERILDHLPSDWGDGYPNVWLGVSAENQEYANQRIPVLLAAPATIRFVSAEPLLGPINLLEAQCGYGKHGYRKPLLTNDRLDWVIVGGETGDEGERREFKQEWAETLRDQCKAAGMAFWMKQMGGFRSKQAAAAIPPELRIREFPKVATAERGEQLNHDEV